MEAVHGAMGVQVAPHEALSAPQDDAANVNALADAVEYIFQSITAVQDDEALDTIWIRSERPYQIEISLRMLQETVLLFGQFHSECFNLAVRKLASAEVESTAGTRMLGNKHFFDLQFHSQARALRHSWTNQETRTEVLIDNVVVRSFPKYDVFNSNIYLLPFVSVDSSYGLLVVNMESRRVLPIDPCIDAYGGPYNFHSTETRKEVTMLKQEFNNVLHMRIPGWNTNLMDWSVNDKSSNGRRKDSAFFVLQEMAHHNGTAHSGRMTTRDSIQLRKNLLVQMLTIKNNEAAGNIPAGIRAALRVFND
ncbi:hypothetical protein VPH35_096925 [Triticum aestivum]